MRPPGAFLPEEFADMGELAPSHWLVVIVVLVLLFGSAKLPE